MQPETNLIFVYGTLLKGEGNHPLMGEAKFVGRAVLPFAKMFNVGAFPAVVISHIPGQEVTGELYRVDAPTLKRLDRLEVHPTMYRRTEVKLKDLDGNWYNAEVYIWQRETAHLRPIRSGNWRQYRAKTRGTQHAAQFF